MRIIEVLTTLLLSLALVSSSSFSSGFVSPGEIAVSNVSVQTSYRALPSSELRRLLRNAMLASDPNQIRTLLESHVLPSQSSCGTLQQTANYFCVGTSVSSRQNEFDINAAISQCKTLLHWVAEYGHNDLVPVLLIRGANIDSKRSQLAMTPLMYAAINGHVVVVTQLLGALVTQPERMHSLITVQDNDRQTALHYAAKNGHDAVVALLLNALATQPELINSLITIQSRHGWTALHWAASNGHDAVVALLFNALVTRPERIYSLVTRQNSYHRTALHYAAENGHEAVVVQLLNALTTDPEHMYNLITTQDNAGWTALRCAIVYGYDAVVVRLLSALAVDPERMHSLIMTEDDLDKTALHYAAKNGHDTVVVQLLNALTTQPERMYSLITAQDNDGWTVLYYVCVNCKAETVIVLLERYKEALDKIASYTSSSAARFSSTCNDSPNLMDREGNWALNLSVTYDCAEIIDLLAQLGANLSVKDRSGDTCLHRAAKAGRSAVVIALVRNGVKSRRNNAGKTPHDVAQGLTSEALSLLEC